jgi:hypothetical protein
MKLTLTDATARLSTLVRESLSGAELIEFKPLDETANESRYVVRWKRATRTYVQEGTHVACLHIDGRSMLVWGHYTQDEADARRDYQERT